MLSAMRASRFLLAASKSGAKASSTPRGLAMPFPVSSTLASFLGSPESSRANAVKQIWDYIKQHNLQNSANKKEILCDSKLKALFDGRDKVTMTEIPKYLSNHFVKTKPSS